MRVRKSPRAQFAAIHRAHRRTCRARGWCSTSHNRTPLDANRRTRHARIEIRRTERAVLRGMDADGICCASAVQGSLRESLSGTIDAPTIHECAARGGGDRAEVVRVHEIHVTNIRVQNIDISNVRIVDVDDVNEPMAAVEPWVEWLTPAEREPAHAKAESKTPAATEETDERRSIDRGTKVRSRAPTPGPANERPASIVVGSKTPRRVIDPSPAPGSNPVPVAVAVGRPGGRHIGGKPHVPILRLVPPSAVVIEIVVAGHIAGNILSGSRAVLFQVAFLSPLVEPIRTGPVDDAKSSGFLNVEHHIGSIDFVDITLPQFPNAEIDGALRNAHLGHTFVEVQKR